MYAITKRFKFEAAHVLPFHDGACARLHGHSYKVEITVGSSTLEPTGPKQSMVIDFSTLSSLFKSKIHDRLDHQFLNDILPCATTAENLAKWIFDELTPFVLSTYRDQRILRVDVWETEDSKATYLPDPR